MTGRRHLTRRELMAGSLGCGLLAAVAPAVGRSPIVGDSRAALPWEQIKHIAEALRALGEPLEESMRILSLVEHPSADNASELERILDKYTLVRVRLDETGVGDCTSGGATFELAELGWCSFLVRVENPARLTGPLTLLSRCAIPEGDLQPGIHESHILGNDRPEIVRVPVDRWTGYAPDFRRWMGFRFGGAAALDRSLEGLALEYQILQLYCQVGGVNRGPVVVAAASLQSSFRLSYTKGFIAEFNCRPAATVSLQIRDTDGQGAMTSLVIRDAGGRLYPAPAHRLEPDLGYQPQVYRSDGETLRLPPGQYSVTVSRGPEYVESRESLVVPAGSPSTSFSIQLERWIDPARFGWYSGDPHLHPEGQYYGDVSQYGLTPESMFRQVSGEGLSVGSILIWSNGYYYEKQFLTGHVYNPTHTQPFPDAQRNNNSVLTPHRTLHDSETLIRYDVEQAGFPSNRLGHLVLLRLKNHDYPGAKSIYDWPSWNLPILKWSRAQGAVAGYAHIGHGMMGAISKELPNYEIPALTDLGANECLVDVTHGLVDFVAGCERTPVADLNPWYHMLNCGFRFPMIGETDFDAGFSRVGAGRTYVKLDSKPMGDQGYGRWVEGIKASHVYFGDGRCHFIETRLNGHFAGEYPLDLPKPSRIVLSTRISVRLDPTPFDIEARQRLENSYNYWNLERARIGLSRNVPLEVVVNGQAVERREILADGELREMTFEIELPQSSWVALRVLPSAHTSPIFVLVERRPIRASRRSAKWCLDCVDVLWQQHAHRIRASERDAAKGAWEHARKVYRAVLSECADD